MKIQTLDEQSAAAKREKRTNVCLLHRHGQTPEEWTWYVAMTTDSNFDAEQWFNRQTGLARVYGNDGKIRAAK